MKKTEENQKIEIEHIQSFVNTAKIYNRKLILGNEELMWEIIPSLIAGYVMKQENYFKYFIEKEDHSENEENKEEFPDYSKINEEISKIQKKIKKEGEKPLLLYRRIL